MTGVTRPTTFCVCQCNTKHKCHSQPHINYVFQEIRFGSSMQLYPYHTYYILHIVFDHNPNKRMYMVRLNICKETLDFDVIL